MRTYNRKSYDIAGYTYNAETLCPGCTRDAFVSDRRGPVSDVEKLLDHFAALRGIDRMDEHSFDSGEFPKVVFVDQLLDGETCDGCGGEL